MGDTLAKVRLEPINTEIQKIGQYCGVPGSCCGISEVHNSKARLPEIPLLRRVFTVGIKIPHRIAQELLTQTSPFVRLMKYPQSTPSWNIGESELMYGLTVD